MMVPATDWPPRAIPSKWIEKLFDIMIMSYGKAFTEKWACAIGHDDVRPYDSLKKHWAAELGKLSQEQIACGVNRLGELDYPPSLQQFIGLCRPKVDMLVAYYEAVQGVAARKRGEMGQWSHPAVFWASAPLAHDLATQTYSQIRSRWESALEAELSKSSWLEIPNPSEHMLALTYEDAQKQVKTAQEVHQIVSDLPIMTKRDHRRWIGKILEREKQRDSSLPAISIKMAKEAMSIREEE